MEPPRPRDEERGREDGGVHEGRAEVGLDEDEKGRQSNEADRGHGRLPLADRPGAVGQESGDDEDDEDLRDLGRLELEEADVDPAVRPADRLLGDKHDSKQHERGDVERPPQAPVDLRVQGGGEREHDGAERHVHALADDEVVRIPGNVVPRDRLQHPEPVGDDSRNRRHEDEIEVAKDGAGLRAPGRFSARLDADGH